MTVRLEYSKAVSQGPDHVKNPNIQTEKTLPMLRGMLNNYVAPSLRSI